ncbi:AMP-binding enzyme [Streptomyces sp. NPDC004980]
MNIYPAEIENAAMALAGVEDAAAVGVPSGDDLGEALVLYLVARPGHALDPDEVAAALSRELAAYKLPSRISVVAELPRDDSGKLYKRELRAAP